MPRGKQKLPLDGILVADFSRVLAGPLATQLLGDSGARVIKIEEPDSATRRGAGALPSFAGSARTFCR
jgi:crotonobetainyl-CoA:carnitine CoA-transferase CaiB-like acyl-CoA transferase